MRRQGGVSGVKLYGPYKHRGRWRNIRREFGKPDVAIPFDTEEEARADIAAAKSELAGKTVMQAIDAWCADMTRRKKSKALVTFSAGCLYRITRVKETGDVQLKSISIRKARGMYDHLVDCGEYSDATHIATLKRARAWMRWCIKQGWASYNPFAEVEKIGKPRKGKDQLRNVPARRLFDLCIERSDLASLAALCGFLLGMRSGEIVSIRGADVDEGGRLLWIPDGKTENARRHVEVPAEMAGLLQSFADKAGPKGRVVPRHVNWPTVALAKLCAAAGVDRVTAHGLRGTHSSLAVRGGQSAALAMSALQEVARSIGHGTNTAITEQHYVRPEATQAAQTAAVLRVIAGGRG
jgi:integrase